MTYAEYWLKLMTLFPELTGTEEPEENENELKLMTLFPELERN